jgi:hypothetical protein
LEISRLRNYATFKKQVRQRFLPDDLDPVEKFNRLGPILIGMPPDRFPGGQEKLVPVLKALEDTLEIFASDFLEGAATTPPNTVWPFRPGTTACALEKGTIRSFRQMDRL